MKKFLISFFLLGGLFLGFSSFAAGTEKTLLDTITEQKSALENLFDTSYATVYKKYQTSVSTFLTSLNYQGLVCLGVIDDIQLLQQIQNDSKKLKIGFLNAYSSLYADTLDLEQKQHIYQDTAVSLFSSGSNYEVEKQHLLSNLTQLLQDQKKLADQFQSLYDAKIQQFVKDYYDYSEKNKTILNTISTRIQLVNSVNEQYTKLVSDLLNYQKQLAGSGTQFFTKLYLLKQTSLSGLDISLQNSINKEVKKYKILPTLGTELEQQKTYALGLFGLQIDEKINLLLSQWYDNKEFTQITTAVQNFISKYSTKDQCSSLISSSGMDQQINELLSKISTFSKTFSLQTLPTNASGFQDKVNKWFPVITQLQKDITTSFLKAVTQKEEDLLALYRQKIGASSIPINMTSGSVSPSSLASSSFQFSQVYKKGQIHSDIKILQQLLTTMNYYSGAIDGIYSSKTIEAVYKYQLAKGLLKGYEKKPQTWGWMGPSTRAALNKDLGN